MKTPFTTRRFSAALGLTLALASAEPIMAQTSSGTQSLSSGSGEGTGTGTGAGMGVNSTGGGTGNLTTGGSLSPDVGVGRMGNPFGPPGGYLDTNKLRNLLQGAGRLTPSPGARSQPNLPTDPGLVPLDAIENPGYIGLDGVPQLTQEQLDQIDARALDAARAVQDPAERTLALERVARMKIFGRKFDDAVVALNEAGTAARRLPPGLVRDLRLLAIITTSLTLAQEQTREATADESLRISPAEKDLQVRSFEQRQVGLKSANASFIRAIHMALLIENTNFQSEQLYKIAAAQALQSKDIALDAANATTSRSDLKDLVKPLAEYADRALTLAAKTAYQSKYPVWRDRALVDVVGRASESDQLARALDIARTVPGPEFRTDALTRVAERLARRGLTPEATKVYEEVATTISTIPIDDTRSVLAGVLIDSLIAVGQFDDARIATRMLNNPQRQVFALGSVAESQGRRGLAASAMIWIRDEPNREAQSYLTRRVADGVLNGIDQLRTQAISRQAPSSGRE